MRTNQVSHGTELEFKDVLADVQTHCSFPLWCFPYTEHKLMSSRHTSICIYITLIKYFFPDATSRINAQMELRS